MRRSARSAMRRSTGPPSPTHSMKRPTRPIGGGTGFATAKLVRQGDALTACVRALSSSRRRSMPVSASYPVATGPTIARGPPPTSTTKMPNLGPSAPRYFTFPAFVSVK